VIKAVKNSAGNFDVLSNDDQLGEITILDTWSGEALFEHTSRELLDTSDMAMIIRIMEVCAECPEKDSVELYITSKNIPFSQG